MTASGHLWAHMLKLFRTIFTSAKLAKVPENIGYVNSELELASGNISILVISERRTPQELRMGEYQKWVTLEELLPHKFALTDWSRMPICIYVYSYSATDIKGVRFNFMLPQLKGSRDHLRVA